MTMKLNKQQQLAIKNLYNRFLNQLDNKSYKQFRKRVHPEIGYATTGIINIHEIGLTFGIEPDGYTHT